MQIHYSCHKNIEGVAPEEGITLSHLPDHDDTETVASLLTEFEQEKTASPLPQDTEDFTALLKKSLNEKRLCLPCQKIHKMLVLCLIMKRTCHQRHEINSNPSINCLSLHWQCEDHGDSKESANHMAVHKGTSY